MVDVSKSLTDSAYLLDKLPDLLELKYNSVGDAVTTLGSVTEIRDVFIGFQEYLYSDKTPA